MSRLEDKDFRIGNYVRLLKNGKTHIEAYELGSFDIYKLDESDCEDVEPIPLTEEWLLKFGFEKKSWKSQGIVIECFYYEKNGIVIYLIEKGFEIEVKHGDDQFNLFRVWNFVHQLQNLYFALCGEELELK